MPVVTLATERLELRVDAEFGGRVISLIDKASGRDWMVPDDLAVRDAGAVDYDDRAARGWDECFPTVAPVDGTAFGWPGMMRDHGLLWGVPTDVVVAGNELTTTWTAPRYRMVRRIVAEGGALALDYELTNTGSDGFDYLYSQHMLLATRAGDTIALSGVERVIDLDAGSSEAWPIAELATVQGPESGIMRKLYAPVGAAFEALVGDDSGRIAVAWQGADMPALGLWISYGGWPSRENGVHQVAIEPTTAQADGLDATSAKRLEPGERHVWRVGIRVE